MPPAGILLKKRSNDLLTGLCECCRAVQAGTPMAVKGEGALTPIKGQGAIFFFFSKISPPEAPSWAGEGQHA